MWVCLNIHRETNKTSSGLCNIFLFKLYFTTPFLDTRMSCSELEYEITALSLCVGERFLSVGVWEPLTLTGSAWVELGASAVPVGFIQTLDLYLGISGISLVNSLENWYHFLGVSPCILHFQRVPASLALASRASRWGVLVWNTYFDRHRDDVETVSECGFGSDVGWLPSADKMGWKTMHKKGLLDLLVWDSHPTFNQSLKTVLTWWVSPWK